MDVRVCVWSCALWKITILGFFNPSLLVELLAGPRDIRASKWMFGGDPPCFIPFFSCCSVQWGWMRRHSGSSVTDCWTLPVLKRPGNWAFGFMWANLSWEVTEGKEGKPPVTDGRTVPQRHDRWSLCWNFGWHPSQTTPPSSELC